MTLSKQTSKLMITRKLLSKTATLTQQIHHVDVSLQVKVYMFSRTPPDLVSRRLVRLSKSLIRSTNTKSQSSNAPNSNFTPPISTHGWGCIDKIKSPPKLQWPGVSCLDVRQTKITPQATPAGGVSSRCSTK